MKIKLRGWEREVVQHEHSVKPVRHGSDGYQALKAGPLLWHDANSAYGKVDKLSLTGAFLVKFEFEDAELENWLIAHAKKNPADALRLVAKAQAEAIIALSETE